ncbi:MAG: hypothetical protein WDM70_05115 [Nitrosomonadales bacterium]
MHKLNAKISWLLGLTIAKLKKISIVSRMVRYLRLSFPGLWGAIVKRLSPFYWRYQAGAHDDSKDAFFKDMPVFDEQQWQQNWLHKRTYNSDTTRNGVMNNRAVVEPAVILERIKVTTNLHKY